MKNDFIYRKKGVLSEEDCSSLIDLFESHPEWQCKGTTGGDRVYDVTLKKDTEMILNFNQPPNSRWILDYLKGCVDEYVEKYPALNDHVRTWGCWEIYKIQRYLPGEGYFSQHVENSGPCADEEPILRRILAWMIYLNDVTDGGQTAFPTQNKKFQPRRGDVLIWPAYFTHPHRGITSKTQKKYIVTGWYNFASP